MKKSFVWGMLIRLGKKKKKTDQEKKKMQSK